MEFPVNLDCLAAVARNTDVGGTGKHALNLVLIYQDEGTRKWAREVYRRVTRLLGEECLSATWWNMNELNQPAVLAGAVSKTLRSDVIVVALHAAGALPLGFYLWADNWLPHRSQGSGALVALIGRSVGPLAHTDGVRKYLSTLARRGRLDFLVEERKLETNGAEPAPEMTSGSASAPALAAPAGWASDLFRPVTNGRSVNKSPSKPHKLRLSHAGDK